MPRLEHQKSKILVILDIMKRTVGEENALSTNELIDMLRREYDIPCDRRTLSDDIKLLQQYINENDEYLFTVNSVRVKKENRYYSLPKRETAEFSNDDLISLITAVNNLPLTDDIDDDVKEQLLHKLIISGHPDEQERLREYSLEKPYVFDTVAAKILIDWIKTLTFIKDRTISDLIGTITRLADSDDITALSEDDKPEPQSEKKNSVNLNIYQFDDMFRAISEKKKLTFKYFSPDENRNKIYHHDGAEYCTEPIDLIPNDGHYYLICYDPKEGETNHESKTRTFRIDRMDTIKKTDEDISEDAREFGKKVRAVNSRTFRMFSGPVTEITLEFGNKFISAIFDAFGDNVKIKRINDELCSLTAEVQLSPPFYAWLFTFGDQIKIIGPQEVIDEYKEKCHNMINTYTPSEEPEEEE